MSVSMGLIHRAIPKASAMQARPCALQSHAARAARVARAAPGDWELNPQNVPDPQIMPDPSFSPEEAVSVQLEALRRNNHPWPNHGIQTAYEYGFDIGGLDPSLYFGFRKDLYHFDHFMGQFQNKLPELVNLESYAITRCVADGSIADCDALVEASVVGRDGKATNVAFHLRRKLVGKRKGAFATWMLLREPVG